MIVKNKYTENAFIELENTKLTDAETILKKGLKAFEEIKKMPSYKRYEGLFEVSKNIEKNNEELAKIISIESGKPIKYSEKEVKRAAVTIQLSAEESKRMYGETLPLDIEPRGINRIAYYNRVPIGTIFSVTPFNDPLNLVAHKVGPAIAAGNSIINKPSSLTPYSSLKLNDLINESELPANSMQTIIASGEGEVTSYFLNSDKIKMVTFTGGPEAAEKLIKKAGIKKYSMELGNNSPVIIWDNTNIDKMIESVVEAAFESQGENCIHAQRILIKDDIYDSIKNKMIHETEKLKIGDPLEHSTDIGPMIGKGEAIRVYDAIREAEKNNAVVLTGGERVENIVKPTILENVNKESEIWKKEIFGPVTIIKPVKSIDEAIALSNDVPYGLQAGIFTSELDIALKAIERLDYGTVLVNDTSDFRIDSMPFGGMKKSGLGREGIRFSIEEMTEIKLAIIKK